MIPPSILIIAVLLLIWLGCLPVVEPVFADPERPPVWAGAFYPDSEAELVRSIDTFTVRAKQTVVRIPADKALKALILPHAGYIYSGFTAAHASLVLKEGMIDKVILMGPDHRVGFRNGAVSETDYRTPLGLVRLHADAARLRQSSDLFRVVTASDQAEHSLEVILPFLQTYLKEFSLVPIVFGPGEVSRLAMAIEPLLTQGTLLVASSDLSHYLPEGEAITRDKETIDLIMALKTEALLRANNAACGRMPVGIITTLAQRHGWQPIFLHYSNSGATTGDHSKVVGYAAIAFYGDKQMEDGKETTGRFTEEQGKALLHLARRTITEKLGGAVKEEEGRGRAFRDILVAQALQAKRGVFVTLKKHGQLRGCVGSLSGVEPIPDGVRRNALNAAFHDSRFAPLEARELDRLLVEVSVLTEPQPLEFGNSQDLLKKLRVGVDGVIIRRGMASATFLPQVWEQLPQPEMFLNSLCRKAGLPPDAWQKPGLEVMTYQVQYFEEEK